MNLRKWAAVAALFAVPLATLWSIAGVEVQDSKSVRGQMNFPVVGGISRADSAGRMLTMSSTGGLSIYDEARDRNRYVTGSLINNQLAASGAAMADSSDPVASYDLKRVGLTFYGIFDSLSTVVRVAVQVRAHFNTSTDSSSTFPWYRWANAGGIPGGAGAGNFKSDSIGHVTLVATSQVPLTAVQATSANSAGGGLLPGEFEVIFNYSRSDTTAAGNGKPFSAPTGIYVPLVGPLGEWFWAPYMSVRVRVINGVRSRFRIRVEYAGTAI